MKDFLKAFGGPIAASLCVVIALTAIWLIMSGETISMVSGATLLVLLGSVLISKDLCIVLVAEKDAYVVERLKSFQRILRSGPHIIIPFIDRVAYRHTLSEVRSEINGQVCRTKDTVEVTVDSDIFWRVQADDEAVYKASYGIQDLLGQADNTPAVRDLAIATLRSKIGTMTFDEVQNQQVEIDLHVANQMNPKTEEDWGIAVSKHKIKAVTPEAAVLEALHKQITAKKEAEVDVARAEGRARAAIEDKKAEITKAEADKEQAILAAEAKKQQQVLEAQGEAEALNAVAAVVGGPEQAVQLKVALAQVAAFGNVAKEGNTVLFPAQYGSLAGVVTNVTEILGALKPASTPEPPKPTS